MLPHDRTIATLLIETCKNLVVLYFNVTFSDRSACSAKWQMSRFNVLTVPGNRHHR